MSLNGTRNSLYRIASFLGDIQALFSGRIFQRIVRKQIYKSSNKFLW